jgi:hypothetical protein
MQRDEARIELEKYTTDSEDDALYNVRRLRKELTAVTEQRDEYEMAFQLAEKYNHKMATELEIVTEQRDEAREKNAKLRDIAERLFAAGVGRMKTDDWRTLRAELDQLKEGAK